MDILRRALSLALALHDEGRIQLVIDTVLSLEREASEDERVSVWFFWFDLLIAERTLQLPQPLKEQIIGNLEAVLKKGIDSIGSEKVQDPFVSKGAAERLANYYAGEKKPTDVTRVISLCIDHFLGLYETINPMQAHAWLEELLDFASQYKFCEAVEKLSVILQQIGSKVHEDMHEHSFRMEIPKKELDEWMDRTLSGSLEESIGRIAASFIPNQKHLEKQVKDMAVQAPLSAFIKMHQFGEDGQPIAKIGSVEDDFSGRLVVQASQNMQIASNFLHEALNRLFAKMEGNPHILVKEIEKSPLFDKSNLEIMERGITAHITGDYLVSVHLLIPQIESSFRNLLKLCQRPIWKKNANGGMDALTLHKLLRDPAVESVFGPDAAGYLKVLLTDNRGWNLRNRICHGLLPSASFGSSPSDRALHVIFLLTQLRRKSAEPET
jgi:hypothetical protein